MERRSIGKLLSIRRVCTGLVGPGRMTVRYQAFQHSEGQVCPLSRPKLSIPEKRIVFSMGKGEDKEEKRVPMDVREVIAENLDYYMGKEEPAWTSRSLEAAAKKDGLRLSYKTVDRLLRPHNYPKDAPTLGTLCALANLLEIHAWEILRPMGRRPMASGHERLTPEKPQDSTSFAQQTKRRDRGRT